ncbi:MAG: thioredoxin-dependent thiol peroxidase [Caldisericaceae bacterium]
MVNINEKATDFELQDAYNKTHRLSDYRGKTVVLYFYPKALTSGCTKEADDFRDNYEILKELNAEVIGISGDKPETLKKFIEKENLPFVLLSDTDYSVCKTYEVYVKKSMYGKTYFGIERTTIIIDKEGIIRKIYRKVKVNGHVQDVINSIKSMEV